MMRVNRRFTLDVFYLCMMAIAAFPIGCHRERDVEITARTRVSGFVNNSPIEGSVVATFYTGRGGSSTCRVTKLPAGLQPASLGTQS
jgi:hypothetical protein